jgi:uncharacterized protein (TIGR00369 family)
MEPLDRTETSSDAQAACERALSTSARAPETFFMARLLGLAFEYAGDAGTIIFDIHDYMLNPQGSLHGGVISLVMDASMGHLMMRENLRGATLEMKTQFIRALRSGRARAIGRIVKRGRTVWFLESHLHDADGVLAATTTATFIVFPDPDV